MRDLTTWPSRDPLAPAAGGRRAADARGRRSEPPAAVGVPHLPGDPGALLRGEQHRHRTELGGVECPPYGDLRLGLVLGLFGWDAGPGADDVPAHRRRPRPAGAQAVEGDAVGPRRERERPG